MSYVQRLNQASTEAVYDVGGVRYTLPELFASLGLAWGDGEAERIAYLGIGAEHQHDPPVGFYVRIRRVS